MDSPLLIKLLKSLEKESNTTRSSNDYKYVIYARRSTDDEERQARSLPDQIAECKELAERLNLNFVDTIAESEKASESGIRPKFNKILERIQSGEIDGIIAWHPDRLARNMREGGLIIDLLDRGTIRDLKFASYTFENTTTGKMLLGISFVLSKQYTDQLSENVNRGIKRSLLEGKYLSRTKHGYKKDRDQYLRPDGDNFIIIKNAFKKRIYDKQILEDIVKYINKMGYTRPEKGIHKRFKMTASRLSAIFKDLIYTGILKYGKTEEIVDLCGLYDFEPMITADEFLKINKIAHLKTAFKLRTREHSDEGIKANFLRKHVICDSCGNIMNPGITNKYNDNKDKVTKYLYIRCNRKECKSKIKGLRGYILRDFALKFVKEHSFTSKKIYDHFLKESQRILNEKLKEANKQKYVLVQEVSQLEDSIEGIKNYLLDETDKEIKEIIKKDLKKHTETLKEKKQELEKLKTNQTKAKDNFISYNKFFELFEHLPTIMGKIKKLEELDYVITKIFTNFRVKNRKVVSYTLKQPFKDFFEKGYIQKLSNGRGSRI